MAYGIWFLPQQKSWHTTEAALQVSISAMTFDAWVQVEPTAGRGADVAGSLAQDDGDFKGALEEVILHSSNEFYRWHTELEAARISETEEKYQHYADTLKAHYVTCQALLGKVAGHIPSALQRTAASPMGDLMLCLDLVTLQLVCESVRCDGCRSKMVV